MYYACIRSLLLTANKKNVVITGFNIPLLVISETIFTANLLTGAKHSAFSTNHVTDIKKNLT